MKQISTLVLLLVLLGFSASAQVDLKYQEPSKEIMELADVPLPPSTAINDDGSVLVLMYRNQYKTISELSEKEKKLAGIRTNPITNVSSRTRFSNNVKLMKKKGIVEVAGMPQNARLSNFSWSPDQSKMAFTNTTNVGTELWYINIEANTAHKLSEGTLNGNLGSPFKWMKDNNSLVVKMMPEKRAAIIDKLNAIPTGPIVSVNEGQKAQNRTYQDLLKDKVDEQNFVSLAESELKVVALDGQTKEWASKAIYRSVNFSPDGNYAIVSIVKKPFSYIVPYRRFPTEFWLVDKMGKKLEVIEKVPLIEELPQGFMAERMGKRDIAWRADKPATLYWAVVLDKGDPEVEAAYRDEVFEWPAPFNTEPKSIFKSINRFAGITWGDDNAAIAYDYWWNTRNTKTYLFNPSNPSQEPEVLNDRNYQDRYSDPGNFVTERNQYHRNVLVLDKGYAYLEGDGHSKEGQKPFIDKMNLSTKKTVRLYQAENKTNLETISKIIDVKKGQIITRVQSQTDYPNYYLRNIKSRKAPRPVTQFENPFKSMAGVHKEVVKYTREDGLPLSGTLYLPAGYDMNNKERLPLVMWAYPTEYKDKQSAGQVTASSNEFTYPWYGSPVFWVMKGYAVLDDASFPIVGEGDEEPNDTFVPQLVANAKAAIDYLDEQGYVDRKRVAVGGHSYGAFMTANLLTHSDLFAAGIARSGAYNRTLTPFGFQSEERNYWEAPDIYNTMSPFMNSSKMKHPLLLIHGVADNNSGTYPMQSERYFNALKGLGATVRLVMLPSESHGYRARESVLHMLWEQDQWMEKYVKNKK
ncbi:prolyl oligopeptidase family serine peptidase [Carboxylicivirga sp. M1479]|uniref:S9 family peptidase n=1 Tax=Carboxylicivirga sp. M1479 TaxID=2594476 RepID=UPI0011784803|nr:prolyl oligopeptidase family serine peptidase [Carboxylicivirga sp. M1479]TRX65942.1 S9 family peptidase [Carboxylicivirga sp. M1479]